MLYISLKATMTVPAWWEVQFTQYKQRFRNSWRKLLFWQVRQREISDSGIDLMRDCSLFFLQIDMNIVIELAWDKVLGFCFVPSPESSKSFLRAKGGIRCKPQPNHKFNPMLVKHVGNAKMAFVRVITATLTICGA